MVAIAGAADPEPSVTTLRNLAACSIQANKSFIARACRNKEVRIEFYRYEEKAQD